MDDLAFIKKLLEIGDKAGAIENLTRFARNNPRNIDGWLLLAKALDDDTKKADCYRYVIRLDPENGIAIQRLKELSEAREYNTYEITPQSVKQKDLKKQRIIPNQNSTKPPSSKKSSKRKKNIKYLILVPFGILSVCLLLSSTLFIFNSAKGLIASPNDIYTLSPSDTPRSATATWTITPRPPTSTPTSTSTIREPTQTATLIPTNTPDSHLFTGSAKSYIPSMSELPRNFYIEYQSPLDFKSGEEFVIGYLNNDPHYYHTDDAYSVHYDILVCNDEATALLVMENIAREEFISNYWSQYILNSDETISAKKVDVNIPGVDNSSVFMANTRGWQVPGISYFTIIKSRNFIATTWITSHNLGGSEAKAQNQAIYYTSLVTQKLNP